MIRSAGRTLPNAEWLRWIVAMSSPAIPSQYNEFRFLPASKLLVSASKVIPSMCSVTSRRFPITTDSINGVLIPMLRRYLNALYSVPSRNRGCDLGVFCEVSQETKIGLLPMFDLAKFLKTFVFSVFLDPVRAVEY